MSPSIRLSSSDMMASANAMGAYEGTLAYTGECIVDQ